MKVELNIKHYYCLELALCFAWLALIITFLNISGFISIFWSIIGAVMTIIASVLNFITLFYVVHTKKIIYDEMLLDSPEEKEKK